jgi:hypothetical protein
MKLGTVAATVGMLLLGFGIFMIGDRSGRITGTALVAGFVLLSLGISRLIWAGWHGSQASCFLVAVPAAVFTWAFYELIRQAIPLPAIGVLGEMTAPTLSTAVAVGILVIGWLRPVRSRDIRQR